MAGKRGDWCEFGSKRLRGETCPICGSSDWCTQASDENGLPIVWCARNDQASAPKGWKWLKAGGKGGNVFAPEGADVAPEPPALKKQRAKRAQEDEKKRLQRARSIWKSSQPLNDRAIAYLRSRGLALTAATAPATLRFHPAVDYNPIDGGESRRLPAIVCAVLDKRGQRLVALHRIYLDPEHDRRRLDAPDSKKLLGSPNGGAIRLGDDADIAGKELFFCEGLETGLAIRQATGAVVWVLVSTSGMRSVEIPKGADAPATLIIAADLDAIDKHGNYPGQDAAKYAAERARLTCKDVRVALPPLPPNAVLSRDPGPNHVKSVDWLDVFNRCGASETGKLLRGEGAEEKSEAPVIERWRNRPGGRIGVRKDPNDQADELLRRKFKGPGRLPTVRRWNECWWLWERDCWREATEEEMQTIARRFLRMCDVAEKRGDDYEWGPLKVTTRTVSEALQAMKPACLLDSKLNMPAWVGRSMREVDGPMPAKAVIACESGLLNTDAWCDGTVHVEPHQPAWFSQTLLPFSLPEGATPGEDAQAWAQAPTYQAFIERLFDEKVGERTPQIDAWHQWVGYCMTPDTSLQKAMCIQGLPGTGKGTLLNLFQSLVGGERQIASTTWTQLGKQFGCEPLIGKLNVIMADSSSPKGSDAHTGAEIFKMITGNDVVPVGRKTVRNLSGVRLPCRFTIAMNEVVKIPDESGAFQRRLIWLHVPLGEHEAPDPGLLGKLRKELPWICVLALNGLMAVRDIGTILQPEPGRRLAQEFRSQASSVLPFVEDCCKLGADCWIDKKTLYEAYIEWVKETNSYELSRVAFGRKLLNANIGVKDQRESAGGRATGYSGIMLASAAQSTLPGV